MSYIDGSILKGNGRELYVVEAGCRRQIACCITFDAMGFDWDKLIFISDEKLNSIPLGEPVTIKASVPRWTEANRLLRSWPGEGLGLNLLL